MGTHYTPAMVRNLKVNSTGLKIFLVDKAFGLLDENPTGFFV